MAPDRAATSFSNGHAHGKQQGQVVEHRAAALVHDVQNGIHDGAGVNEAGQAIGFQHGFVGERTADAQQKAGYRQQGNGQHKRAADALQNTENFVFHQVSSLHQTMGDYGQCIKKDLYKPRSSPPLGSYRSSPPKPRSGNYPASPGMDDPLFDCFSAPVRGYPPQCA